MSHPHLASQPGSLLRRTRDVLYRDHQGQVVSLPRADRLTKGELVDLVDRIRRVLWFREELAGGDEEHIPNFVSAPDLDNGGVGGADGVDLVVGILDSVGLNPNPIDLRSDEAA